MAIMQGLTPVRGRLGGTGFRQQTVRTGRPGSGTYRRRTVAFQIQETVTNPNAPGQQRQRSAFALTVALGSALNAKGILPNFYPSGTGLGNFQKFVSDNVLTLAQGGSIVQNPNSPADVYVDFRYLRVARGSITVPIEVFQGPSPDSDCDCTRQLAWSFDATQGWPTPYSDWKLLLIGIKIDSTGAIEDIVQSQPCATIDQCVASVTLPKCDCCKTYWYGFFVNAFSGYNTSSVYLGTCENSDQLPVYDPENCLTCNVLATDLVPFTPPSEMPVNCGDEAVDMTNVYFNGGSNFANIAGPMFNPVVGCPVDCPDCDPLPALFSNQLQYTYSLAMDPAVDSPQVVLIADSFGTTVFDQVFNNYNGTDVDSQIKDNIAEQFKAFLPAGYTLSSLTSGPDFKFDFVVSVPTGATVSFDGTIDDPTASNVSGLALTFGSLDGVDSITVNGSEDGAIFSGAAKTAPTSWVLEGTNNTIEVGVISATCSRKFVYTLSNGTYLLTNIIITDILPG